MEQVEPILCSITLGKYPELQEYYANTDYDFSLLNSKVPDGSSAKYFRALFMSAVTPHLSLIEKQTLEEMNGGEEDVKTDHFKSDNYFTRVIRRIAMTQHIGTVDELFCLYRKLKPHIINNMAYLGSIERVVNIRSNRFKNMRTNKNGLAAPAAAAAAAASADASNREIHSVSNSFVSSVHEYIYTYFYHGM